MIPEHLCFTYLKRHVSILDVLIANGLHASLKKRGDQLFGPCPLHGGDNPNAFVVSLSKNVWRCFTRCDAGGDVVELVRLLNKMTHSQAAVYLAGLADRPRSPPSFQSAFAVKPDKAFRPFIKRLHLDSSNAWFKKKGISSDTSRRFEAGIYHGKGFLSDCVGVRLHDLKGRPIGYAGRRLVKSQVKKYGKWKFPVRLPKNQILYNYHRVRSQADKGVIVVEGPWSVMRLNQLKIPSVALLGINLSSIQHEIVRKISPVLIMLDGDHAGRKAAIRIKNALHQHPDTKIISLPFNLDPDDLNDHQLLNLIGRYFF
jgi:DNA primase